MEFLIVFVGLVVYLALVFTFGHIMRSVKQQRTLLYMELLREHRYWHKCHGGLGVDDEGKITHFKVTEAEGYDYD